MKMTRISSALLVANGMTVELNSNSTRVIMAAKVRKGEAIQDLDNLPFPAKDLFYQRLPGLARTYTATTSRGCPYKCTYCYNAVMLPIYRSQGRWLRQRSVDNVIEELTWAKKSFHPRHFLFMDDVFATNTK